MNPAGIFTRANFKQNDSGTGTNQEQTISHYLALSSLSEFEIVEKRGAVKVTFPRLDLKLK